ncbi:low-temperature-induced 65 kDa protein [Carica papaya]|uniref:low-temperature-induced 65 kDa protein n=1 Tax=Carica papaya TaxID=3649 RepID=UPI000B8CF14D|nr:low-temperature-induced 65 kDa protein [Carica papaya]
MEPVVTHQSRDQEQVRNTQIVGQPQEGEEQEEHRHHAKKSTKVLKKVKEKAKKIKDTLTKHGHGHNHDHDDGHADHVPDDHDLDEEDDEDEEMEEDPEVHGAPIYESIAGSDVVTGQREWLSHPGKGISMAPKHDPIYFRESRVTDPTKTFIHVQEEVPGQPKVNLERPRGLDEDPAAPKKSPDACNTPSNYQSKVTDPTGKGKEAEMEPILRSLDKMKVYDEPEHEAKIKPEPEEKFLRRTDEVLSQFPTGSHDQFSPEPIPPKPVNVSPENHPQSDPGAFADKISSATSAIAGKAISAKTAIASKLGYREKDSTETDNQYTHNTASASDYGKKIATTVREKLSPVYQKVAGAGSDVMSKQQGSDEPGAKGENRGVSMREYVAEKLKPKEEDRALSEVISGALHKRKEESDQKVDDDKPRGKVTESEEVADRLGTGDGAEKRVVDKFKGALSSWFGKSDEPRGQTPQQSVSPSSYAEDEGFPRFGTGEVEQTVTSERRVEE